MVLATSRTLHLQLHFTRAEPGGVITDFSKNKSGLRIKKADLGCLEVGF